MSKKWIKLINSVIHENDEESRTIIKDIIKANREKFQESVSREEVKDFEKDIKVNKDDALNDVVFGSDVNLTKKELDRIDKRIKKDIDVNIKKDSDIDRLQKEFDAIEEDKVKAQKEADEQEDNFLGISDSTKGKSDTDKNSNGKPDATEYNPIEIKIKRPAKPFFEPFHMGPENDEK